MYVWTALAAGVGLFGEVWYRTHTARWWPDCWPIILLSVFGSYCIWQLLREHTLLEVAVLFALGKAVATMAANWWIGDRASTQDLIGFGLVVGANVLRMVWR